LRCTGDQDDFPNIDLAYIDWGPGLKQGCLQGAIEARRCALHIAKKGAEQNPGVFKDVKNAFFLAARCTTKAAYDAKVASMRKEFPKASKFIAWFDAAKVQLLFLLVACY
jgi:hypothetical protein